MKLTRRNHPLHRPQVVYFYFEHVAVEFGVVARKRCNEGVAVFEQQKFFEGEFQAQGIFFSSEGKAKHIGDLLFVEC